MISVDRLSQLLVSKVDLVEDLALRLRQLGANLADEVLAGAEHVLVLVDHLPVLHNGLAVGAQAHLVLQHGLFVVALGGGMGISELLELVFELIMHRVVLILQLLVNLVQADRIQMDIDEFLLVDAHSLVEGGLVDAGKRHVSDLLHGEHARLLEAILLHVVAVGAVLFYFKLVQLGDFRVVFLVRFLVSRVFLLSEVEVLPLEQRLPRLLQMRLLFLGSLLLHGRDLCLQVITPLR